MNIHNVRWNGQVAVVKKKKPREIGSGKGIGREKGREQSWFRHGVRYVVLWVWEGSPRRAVDAIVHDLPQRQRRCARTFKSEKIQKHRRWSVSHIFEHTQAPSKRFRDDTKSYIIKFVRDCLLLHHIYLLVNAPYARRVDLRDARNLCLHSLTLSVLKT